MGCHHIYYATKATALKALKAEGYSEKVGEGRSGDHAHGSRIYMRKPGQYPNQPHMHTATVSKIVAGRWAISIFKEGN